MRNMKPLGIMAMVLALLMGTALAWGYDDDCDSVDGYGGVRDKSEYPYESNTGQRYKYDLSRPGDQLRYEVDPGAQLRDEINPSPRIDLDRNMGQFGGGAK